jgi:tetratricopeptide (TPR) repeat protein
MKHESAPPSDTAPTAIDPGDSVALPAGGPDPAGVVGLALGAAGHDPGVAVELRQYLHRQNEIAAKQGLVAERQAELLARRIESSGIEQQHVEAQNQHLHMLHIHDRMRLVLDAGLAALGVTLLVGIAWLLYGAITDRSIVVNAFSVPPRLAEQGYDGATVASGFLDELARLRSATYYSGEKRSVTGTLAQQVQVEIPEVRVSFGELRRLLHQSLGHLTEIHGTLVDSAGGYALTLRGTDLPAQTFSGKTDELPALLTRAAEYAYGNSDRRAMAYYLERAGRSDEAIEFIRATYGSATAEERPVLLNAWGNSLGRLGRNEEALEKYRAARELKPDYMTAYSNSIGILAPLGREEEALHRGEKFERDYHRGQWNQAKGVDESWFGVQDFLRWDLLTELHGMEMDMESAAGHGNQSQDLTPIAAIVAAQLHDPAQAEFLLQTASSGLADPFVAAMAALSRGTVALDLQRAADAASAADEMQRVLADAPIAARSSVNYGYDCWWPLAYELAGRRADADRALAAAQSEPFVDCDRFRGDLLNARGDWAGAVKSYEAGVARAPSLPPVYLNWARALLGRKDFAGAIAKAQAAHQRGPHWADPLEIWGEALAAQGQYPAAVAQYTAAYAYAPKWGALQLHWGEALERMGDRTSALDHYRQASSFALSDADRATVTAKLAALGTASVSGH